MNFTKRYLERCFNESVKYINEAKNKDAKSYWQGRAMAYFSLLDPKMTLVPLKEKRGIKGKQSP